jgi:hypothetical protein
MSEEHRHIWGQFGCYCGAQRCLWSGFYVMKSRDGDTQILSEKERAPYFSSLRFCNDAADTNTGSICRFHAAAEKLLAELGTPYVTIDQVKAEMSLAASEGWKDATFGG